MISTVRLGLAIYRRFLFAAAVPIFKGAQSNEADVPNTYFAFTNVRDGGGNSAEILRDVTCTTSYGFHHLITSQECFNGATRSKFRTRYEINRRLIRAVSVPHTRAGLGILSRPA